MAEHRKRHLTMLLLGAAGMMLLGAIAGAVVLLSGVMNTSATRQHFRVTHRILDLGLDYSVRAKTDEIVAPSLDDPGFVERGHACYRQHCVVCHGAPGEPPGAAALGMMPVPTNLAGVAREQSPEWLYYVTRNGIRMTGMPAWQFRLSDDDLWAVVAFLRRLPALSAADYRARDAAAAGLGCTGRAESQPPPTPEAEVVLRQYACHSCHVIEGVVGPKIHVGPALAAWPRRALIAGTLPNTRDNLVRFLRAPHEVSRGSLMPDLGVTEADARVMAEYLFAAR
jgi:mono/diheme cytochrome c family protein/cytochrome c2